MEEVQNYIFILLGLALLLLAVFIKAKNAHLKEIGIKTDGIVYRVETDKSGPSSNYYFNIMKRITVRFMTKDQEWITETASQDFASFLPGQYKPGDKLTLFYNQNNPSEFYVAIGKSEFWGRLVFLVVGLIFLGLGVYNAFIKVNLE